MNINMWNLVFYISSGVFLVCALVMLIAGFVRNRFYHNYHKDELIKKTRTVNSLNKLYFTAGETTRYIKKYVICTSSSDKYVIANYNKPYDKVSFYVMCYGVGKRPFKIFRYSEFNTNVSSQLIVVPRRTKKINIVIGAANEQVINYNVIKPVSLSRIKTNAVFNAAITLSGLLMIRHMIAYLICGTMMMESFFNSYENYGIMLGSLILSVVVFFVTKSAYKKKNKKNFNGGAVEYEFL